MKNKYTFLLILMASACTSNLTTKQYYDYVNNVSHGLIVDVKNENIAVEIKYRPAQYMAYNEVKGEQKNEEFFLKKVKEYEGLQYFEIVIMAPDKKEDVLRFNSESGADYYNRIEYFSNIFQQDIMIVQGKDTLPCRIAHYERTYKITPFATILTAFEKKKGDITFYWNDRMFSHDILKLEIKEENINQIPNLKI